MTSATCHVIDCSCHMAHDELRRIVADYEVARVHPNCRSVITDLELATTPIGCWTPGCDCDLPHAFPTIAHPFGGLCRAAACSCSRSHLHPLDATEHCCVGCGCALFGATENERAGIVCNHCRGPYDYEQAARVVTLDPPTDPMKGIELGQHRLGIEPMPVPEERVSADMDGDFEAGATWSHMWL